MKIDKTSLSNQTNEINKRYHITNAIIGGLIVTSSCIESIDNQIPLVIVTAIGTISVIGCEMLKKRKIKFQKQKESLTGQIKKQDKFTKILK